MNYLYGLSPMFVVEAQSDPSPIVGSMAITPNPGTDETYRAGDHVEVTVSFSEPVIVTGSPHLVLAVGTETGQAVYDPAASNGAEVAFAYPVAPGNSDDYGISISPSSLHLNSGTIKDAADNDAGLYHNPEADQIGHKVDAVAPELVSAMVNGSTLRLIYNEGLNIASSPAVGDFSVQVAGTARIVSQVAVRGTTVKLTLASAVSSDEEVTVTYTMGAMPIRDAPGTDAANLEN